MLSRGREISVVLGTEFCQVCDTLWLYRPWSNAYFTVNNRNLV